MTLGAVGGTDGPLHYLMILLIDVCHRYYTSLFMELGEPVVLSLANAGTETK
jgi:hypothetical protein